MSTSFSRGPFNDKAEDERLLQLEEQALKREIHWLLTKEFPYACSRIGQTIDECMLYMKRSPGQGRSPEEEAEIQDERKPITFESPTKNVEGYAVIQGWNITEAKIAIKLQRLNKGLPFKTEISTTPWKLTQLHDAHNYLALAREDLDSTNFQSITLQQANKIINRVALKIKQAQDQLLMSDSSSINEYHSQMAFLPKLPNNLSIEFSISHRCLDINVYLVQQVMNSPRRANPGAHETIVDQHKQKLYEVLEHISLHRPNQKLEYIFKFIQTLYDLCSELREKIIALSSMSATCI